MPKKKTFRVIFYSFIILAALFLCVIKLADAKFSSIWLYILVIIIFTFRLISSIKITKDG
ncbi:hypothetical protein [Pseudobacteroides cellulosolvens]|uniref:Uncharacterized protein n=1 Tax=Pseudobacteroides cellulosolvens ATCC 35603 = DSM 2933 TaxID=398512 RepID=A0A0L6JRY3_9FIRM|nr:hypothetical protein [Pseudobacteroides cellulosolvens]KNY28460.1 hypothetical protein Bccel_3734 [Pseudobacteroides cellulosolvens ATCC 35603 = DSM 2933]